MKKILCFMIITFFVMTSAAFCWTVDSGGASGDQDIGDFKASKNVKINVASSAQAYAAISKHVSGDKEYGVAYDSSVVFVKDKDKGTDPDSISTSDHTAFNDWESM